MSLAGDVTEKMLLTYAATGVPLSIKNAVALSLTFLENAGAYADMCSANRALSQELARQRKYLEIHVQVLRRRIAHL